MKFYATLLILTLLLGFCEARRATNGYATSFVFLTARNTDTGDEVQVCANYLQYKFRRIAPDEESAVSVILIFSESYVWYGSIL
ncbi:unnamed protein product [Haemonchus placei]|uniref:Secreted protein n=1 Tax=Haemonchus placei TaxID=6290 RepID=A0A0N4X3U0_HAEPC|nr:unnamed protein product [Haemonchus placei]